MAAWDDNLMILVDSPGMGLDEDSLSSKAEGFCMKTGAYKVIASTLAILGRTVLLEQWLASNSDKDHLWHTFRQWTRCQ